MPPLWRTLRRQCPTMLTSQTVCEQPRAALSLARSFADSAHGSALTVALRLEQRARVLLDDFRPSALSRAQYALTPALGADIL